MLVSTYVLFTGPVGLNDVYLVVHMLYRSEYVHVYVLHSLNVTENIPVLCIVPPVVPLHLVYVVYLTVDIMHVLR